MQRAHGYITSVHYPRAYPPDCVCSCNLTAVSPPDGAPAHVVLHVLDVSLDMMPGDSWHSDWLEYAGSERQWGDGRLLQAAAPQRRIHTRETSLLLNFRSNHRNEKRGFWIEYEGEETRVKTTRTPENDNLYGGRANTNSPRMTDIYFYFPSSLSKCGTTKFGVGPISLYSWLSRSPDTYWCISGTN